MLELCSGIAGPYCTKLMADMGAEVIKIESPGAGDESRLLPPFRDDVPNAEGSGLFFYLNSNKLGVTLDISRPQGTAVFADLVKRADILMVDRPVSELEDSGLGYETLHGLNTGLIVATLTPYGESGPYRDYRARELNISHCSGQGYLLPIPSLDTNRAPVKPGGHMADCDGGLVAVLPILAALFWKGSTGDGQLVEISRQEALISMQRVESVTFANDGVVIGRAGDGKDGMPGGMMACKDGYVVLVTPQEHQWRALIEMVGDPEWSSDGMCRDPISRSANAATINQLLEKWMLQHTKEEIFRKGQALSCPVAPVYTAEDIAQSEQYRARDFFMELDHPELGRFLFPSCAYRFSETPWALERLAPRLGEHNEQILCGELGYRKQDLARLRQSGTV